jgi:hypothetical protein
MRNSVQSALWSLAFAFAAVLVPAAASALPVHGNCSIDHLGGDKYVFTIR